MSSRFTALPINDGESFLLETDQGGRRWVILVDGGKKSSPKPDENTLLEAIRDHAPGVSDRIDIAVCTHKDSDHAAGFPDFIRAWTANGGTIGEFWLPGGWSAALPDAVTDPDKLLSELTLGAAMAADALISGRKQEAKDKGSVHPELDDARPPAFASIDERLRRLRAGHQNERDAAAAREFAQRTAVRGEDYFASTETSVPDEVIGQSLGIEGRDVDTVRAALAQGGPTLTQRLATADAQSLWVFMRYRYLPLRAESLPHVEQYQLTAVLLKSVVETADIIREIATVAIEHRVRVRWFDFEPFEESHTPPMGGYSDLLRPLNTLERPRPRAERTLALFVSLRLTEQNVASLVFQRPETESEPGVLFLADSRLAFGIDRPEASFPKHLRPFDRPIIFTAPHHGSRNNDRAYQVLREEWLDDRQVDASYAIRNGGVWNQTLADFLAQPNRRCAHCYQCHGGQWGQAVSVGTDATGNWNWASVEGSHCGTPRPRQPRRTPS